MTQEDVVSAGVIDDVSAAVDRDGSASVHVDVHGRPAEGQRGRRAVGDARTVRQGAVEDLVAGHRPRAKRDHSGARVGAGCVQLERVVVDLVHTKQSTVAERAADGAAGGADAVYDVVPGAEVVWRREAHHGPVGVHADDAAREVQGVNGRAAERGTEPELVGVRGARDVRGHDHRVDLAGVQSGDHQVAVRVVVDLVAGDQAVAREQHGVVGRCAAVGSRAGQVVGERGPSRLGERLGRHRDASADLDGGAAAEVGVHGWRRVGVRHRNTRLDHAATRGLSVGVGLSPVRDRGDGERACRGVSEDDRDVGTEVGLDCRIGGGLAAAVARADDPTGDDLRD